MAVIGILTDGGIDAHAKTAGHILGRSIGNKKRQQKPDSHQETANRTQ